MGGMKTIATEHAALLEATRVRLSKEARAAVAEHVELHEFMSDSGDKHDKLLANALAMIWAMYVKVEALSRGEA